MATKALFFDVDGTLVSFKTHLIPDSTVEALTQAKERGVKIFIATGRPTQFITNLGQIEHLVDGWVTTNGANCFIGDNTIRRKVFSREEVMKLLDYSDVEGFPTIIVGSKDIAVHNYCKHVDDIFRQGLGVVDIDFSRYDITDLEGQDILQLTPFCSSEQEAYIVPRMGQCISGRWCNEFTDITVKGADKGEGVAAMAEYIGIDISETMAFGDGGNDNTMIARAGIGIAMGNANEKTKLIADYITDHIDENGVSNALLHFGVI